MSGAEKELDHLIERRAAQQRGRDAANAEAAEQAAREARRLAERRAFNLSLWEEHYCNQYRFHLNQTREAARKYKALRDGKRES